MTTATQRTERLNMRLTPEARKELVLGAEVSNQDLTSFVIGAALEKARRVILERNVIRVSARDFNQLLAALDEPPQYSEGVAKVFETYERLTGKKLT